VTDPESKLAAAKLALSRAASDCLRNMPGAAERADAALAEVAGLQAQLKASKSRECMAEGCHTLTLGLHCDRHRPPAPAGVWAIAAQVRGEIERGEG
jgi:hypothetical protein